MKSKLLKPVILQYIHMFFFRRSVIVLCQEIYTHAAILAYYMIPAFLYCLYNNLSFTNLAFFDPTTYFMFMQIRLLMTGVIYQVGLRGKKLRNYLFPKLVLCTEKTGATDGSQQQKQNL